MLGKATSQGARLISARRRMVNPGEPGTPGNVLVAHTRTRHLSPYLFAAPGSGGRIQSDFHL